MTDEQKRLQAAEHVIEAQRKLLVCYRLGKNPGKTLDILYKWEPIWDELTRRARGNTGTE